MKEKNFDICLDNVFSLTFVYQVLGMGQQELGIGYPYCYFELRSFAK
jgi:hypothetical protein